MPCIGRFGVRLMLVDGMTESVPSEAVIRHAGFVMAHAALIVSSLEAHELVCPFVVQTTNGRREMLAFESETQDEAVSRAWESLERAEQAEVWAMAREGLVSTARGKADVLLVAAWEPGMHEALVFLQAFQGRGGTFQLIGPIECQFEVGINRLVQMRSWFHAGINEHPKAERWWGWANAVQPAVPADVPASASRRRGRR